MPSGNLLMPMKPGMVFKESGSVYAASSELNLVEDSNNRLFCSCHQSKRAQAQSNQTIFLAPKLPNG
jgi:hypothetical protein